MRRVLVRIGRTIRFAYLKTLRIKAPPHSIGLGMAIGVFVGFLPLIPFQTVIAVTLAFFFRCSKITAALGTWVTNPANVVFVYYFLYRIGRLLVPGDALGFDPNQLALTEMFTSGWHLVMIMSVGGLVVGIPAAVLTYFLTVRLILVYHEKRAARRLRKAAGKR
jgi:uncharacterized protein (DUF2062 family)